MSKITIREVAQESGVSIGTVSRVLNNRPGVKEYTRQRVLEAMKSLGYQPDIAARELSTRSGLRIGLNVAPGTKRLTPFFFLFTESLMNRARVDGLRFEEVGNLSNGLPEQLTDGMILFGAHDADPRITFLKERQVPFVLLGRGEGISSINGDDFDGGYQAGSHLIALGHRKIVHIGGYLQHQASNDRYEGFIAALRDNGIEQDPKPQIDGGFTALGAYRGLSNYLQRDKDFTAIFAASDEMAAGAFRCLEDHQISCPGDVSIVGYDDLPEIGERFTTIHQDIPSLADETLVLLSEQIEGRAPRHITMPVQLIARQTTCRCV
ncbi:LacI family DNA-binding transcriptional regulator [Salinispira pacifica]|uniref:Transcriptional regulator, LacI family n=1 Tax=Salinispira pacifica TaxID=1307761 RepID=V5WLP0_9SPIO|nr:LacI family DNA-binding transcriptional regulator [Salinispira pacifica]AHC16520.1 Transcriptional regulator, LacI family [Salinispira pacifica]